MSFGESIAVVRQAGSAVSKTIPESLINRHGASRSVEANGPRRGQGGLGRKIETQGDAEFTLLAVSMLLEFGSAEIGGEINVGRLERLAGQRSESGCDLMMKEASNRFVIGDVTARALEISELNHSGADQMAVITA